MFSELLLLDTFFDAMKGFFIVFYYIYHGFQVITSTEDVVEYCEPICPPMATEIICIQLLPLSLHCLQT
jgi:hypothetical protein